MKTAKKRRKQHMEPIMIIENKELLLAGCLVKYVDGGNDWAEWEEMDSKADADPKYAHHHIINSHQAHSVFFYPNDGLYVFTGLEVTEEVNDTAWEYMRFPPVTYAVFELDYNVNQDPQYKAIDMWIEANKAEYKRFEWDAGGRVASSEFGVYIYDHGGKFKNRIVELWIPFVKK
jgi:hypothetical protein